MICELYFLSSSTLLLTKVSFFLLFCSLRFVHACIPCSNEKGNLTIVNKCDFNRNSFHKMYFIVYSNLFGVYRVDMPKINPSVNIISVPK